MDGEEGVVLVGCLVPIWPREGLHCLLILRPKWLCNSSSARWVKGYGRGAGMGWWVVGGVGKGGGGTMG